MPIKGSLQFQLLRTFAMKIKFVEKQKSVVSVICCLELNEVFPNQLCRPLQIELIISFLIGGKRRVNFRNQRLLSLQAADYTIIVSRTFIAL